MNLNDLQLLVGLGNPGSKYIGTRHNVGFMAIKRLAVKESIQFSQSKKLYGEIGEKGVGSEKTRLLMPNTFMNESGRSIKSAIEWFGLEVNQILIIVDDMDLPLGRLRLRTHGGAGGHKGLKSAINHLGTESFSRLRIGIGAPGANPEERRLKTNSHVLGKFNAKEIPIVEEVIMKVIEGFYLINELGIEQASTKINSYRKELNITE
tara:strand:+ start:168 stop:788 length:621 start_codon:yes stop_codon:yes gene_type:complete